MPEDFDIEFYKEISELHQQLSQCIASSSYASFLRKLREIMNMKVALLTILKDDRIENISFNADEDQNVKIPINMGLMTINTKKMDLIRKIKKRKMYIIEKPALSLFGNCRLNQSAILAAGHELDTAIIQIGQRDVPLNTTDRRKLEYLLSTLEPIYFSILHAERLLQERRISLLEKSQYERQYEKIFNDAQDMLVDVNAEGQIIQINTAGCRLLGYTNAEQILGTSFKKYFLQKEAYEYFCNHLRKKGYIRDHEALIKNEDQPLICQISATAVYSGRGVLAGFSGSLKDITKRVELDKQLWKMNIEMTETNDKLQRTQMQVIQNEKLASIGQLSAGIAHEINNPLGFIKSNLNAMSTYIDNMAGCIKDLSHHISSQDKNAILDKYHFNHINQDITALKKETADGIMRILAIVSNLKNFARNNAVNGEWDNLDLAEAFRSTLLIAHNEYKYHASVDTSIDDNVPKIECKAVEIQQVFLNLIMNSVQAIKEVMNEDGKIRIFGKATGSSVHIIIEDNGPGIPENARHRIFDPFFTTKEVGKGTGLGLSISYDIIVNKHHGSIHVENSELGGAKFVITLPITQKSYESDVDSLEEL